MKDPFGDRMKRYEAAFGYVVPPRAYTIIRVDGRAFHHYLGLCLRPFDMDFVEDMGAVAVRLCEEIQGSVFAYTQSDEVSVLVADWPAAGSEPWFSGRVQKIVSVAAGIATGALIGRRGAAGAPVFDARVFTVPSDVEAANYFVWRQRDAIRNSVSMAAQAHFTHAELRGVSSAQMQEMLFHRHGINWNDYAPAVKQGQIAVRRSGEKTVSWRDRCTGVMESGSAWRSWWQPEPAPHFRVDGGFLVDVIPSALPLDWRAKAGPTRVVEDGGQELTDPVQ